MKEHIRRRVRRKVGGVAIDSSVDAVVAVNRGSSGSQVAASSRVTTDTTQRPSDDSRAATTDEEHTDE